MSTLSVQITPASPTLFLDEDTYEDDGGAGPSFDGAGPSFDGSLPPKTRNALIGTIFGNRSPLTRKKHYLPTTTPHTTPIGSPRPSYDNDAVSSKRRGSVASPRLGDKLKSFLNVRRGSCIESQIKSPLSISYGDDSNSSPYFVPISPSRSPLISPSKYNQRKSEFRILEDLEELDLENEDSITFVSSERIENSRNDISFDEKLARMVEKMSFEGYSEEQINDQLQKEREINQVNKDFRPKAPIPSSWHNRIIESINRSLRFDSPHQLLPDESNQTPKNILDSLPTEVFSEKFAKDVPHCTVCLSPYNEGEQLKSLPCLHCFHTDCLDQWFKVSCSCPTCKDSI
eukprot:TRINITY_DN926_c0_g1_i1.p1 TRINITY_DN926_c0_g1~~TRINITY_DN926_c0_g1_i1.p1  ORF type:complete len:344 (-),score=68.02 TRINITY_DN926_c0_g1_i1:205-1236(-)